MFFFSVIDDIFNRLDTVHERNGQMDGQTDTGRQQRPPFRMALRSNSIFKMAFVRHFRFIVSSSKRILPIYDPNSTLNIKVDSITTFG